MSQLPLSTVFTVSVSAAQLGANQYNTSNLALFSHEVYQSSFGSLGYQIYTTPLQVGLDFGTGSQTYAMANSVFSQQPNILAGGGALIVIPFVEAEQTLTFSGVAASGTFVFNYGGHASAAINWNDTVSQIQTKIQAMTGLSAATVTGSIASEALVVSFNGIYGPLSLATITSNSLATSAPASITVTVTTTQAGETMAAAVTRTEGLVQYFGLMATLILDGTDILASALVVQPLNKIQFYVSNTASDLNSPSGVLYEITSEGYTNTRGLYYNDASISETPTPDALNFMAAYAGLGLSVNFNGSNTTIVMNLKSLIGVAADPSITPTVLALAQTAGADVYPSFAGTPKVSSSGANSFYDQVYNLQWIIGALQVAGFNYLAEVDTKVPQTQDGMDGLVGALRAVGAQGVTNAYLAPGTWNSSTTFGNQAQFLSNIANLGFYFYSVPISQQLQAARAARQAPLVEVALKEAGAFDSGSIVIYVNS